MKIAFIGDSTGALKNGASCSSVPQKLENLMNSLGGRNHQIDNYSLPGLTWKSAHVATPGFTFSTIPMSPLDYMYMRSQGWTNAYDLIITMLGANSRMDDPHQQIADYFAYRDALPGFDDSTHVCFVGQHFLMDDGKIAVGSYITQQEAENMEAVYSRIADPMYGASFGKLYAMGMHYDELHPTNEGDTWLAASIYKGLAKDYGLNDITMNIAELFRLKTDDPTRYAQLRGIVK